MCIYVYMECFSYVNIYTYCHVRLYVHMYHWPESWVPLARVPGPRCSSMNSSNIKRNGNEEQPLKTKSRLAFYNDFHFLRKNDPGVNSHILVYRFSRKRRKMTRSKKRTRSLKNISPDSKFDFGENSFKCLEVKIE